MNNYFKPWYMKPNHDDLKIFDKPKVTRMSFDKDESPLKAFVQVKVHATMMLIFGACYFVAHFIKILNRLELPFVCFMALFALMVCILVVYGIIKENKDDAK